MSPEIGIALMGLATAIGGWFYTKRVGLEAARRSLEETYRAHIAALQGESQMKDEIIRDREHRLEICEAAIKRYAEDRWSWIQR